LEEVKTYLETESGKARSESRCDYDEQVDAGEKSRIKKIIVCFCWLDGS
jgi:hypothetical protein